MAAEDDTLPKVANGPPRPPTISLPPRSAFESIFRGGGTDASPGPMTLVSSFFAEDPESEYRSFSQLLAGAMNSPAAARRSYAAAAEEGDGGEECRPGKLLLAQPPPFFMVPPGLSPGGLLESPAMFPSNLDHFGMSHQQVLAQVTAQATQSHSHMHVQEQFPSSDLEMTTACMMQPTSSSMDITPEQHMQVVTSDANSKTYESTTGSHYDQRSQPMALVVDKPVDDGYNWRKYGQKQVKGSEYPRSYYKCTHPSCPVKKKVERSLDGQVTEIIYKGQHNHKKPPPSRRGKDGALPNGSNDMNVNPDFQANSGSFSHGGNGNFSKSSEMMAAPSTSKRDRESGQVTSEQLSGSSDSEEVGDAELGIDEGVDSETNPKRRIVEARATTELVARRTVTEPRIIVQTRSEVDLLDDGYRWRKYGQKVVKGNPHPRSYYKCTYAGCNVRKHVERASTDIKAVITTYEGKHNHDVPAARNSSHNTASSNVAANSSQVKAHNTMSNNQQFLKGSSGLRNNVQRPVAVLQLKEEHGMN
ncbi:putative WRKY transcription factor 4 [Iris pallida]|uniref:WRKY transcription factor 4 n=1 Tax=Iris pallida TaxID=29817 RepID=A0AAX6HRN1_IRIPA|nr:putative WRKY transcription factor 4 [Iris pallida]